MKTGFNNINTNSDNNDYKLQMTALVTVFIENALKTASIYTKHSNRKIVTSIDVLFGLKRELFTFLDNTDIETRALEIFNEFKNNELAFSSSDIEDEDTEEEDNELAPSNSDIEDEDTEEDNELAPPTSDIEEEEIEDPFGNYCHIYDKKKREEEKDDEEEDKFTKSNCECNICKEVNEYNEKWKSWKPTNKIEEILYESIQNIDNKFNLNNY